MERTRRRIAPYQRKADSANVSSFIKKHPHHKLVRKTRRNGVKSAGVDGHLMRV